MSGKTVVSTNVTSHLPTVSGIKLDLSDGKTSRTSSKSYKCTDLPQTVKRETFGNVRYCGKSGF